MRTTYRALLIFFTMVLAVAMLRVVRAQDGLDESSSIVAEEMSMEEALSDELLEDEDELLDIYTEEDAEDALAEALGETLDLPEAGSDSDAVDVDGLVDEAPVEKDPLADLEVAPVEDAMPDLEAPALDSEEPAFEEPVVEAITEAAETSVADDPLAGLEVEDVPDGEADADFELEDAPADPSEEELLSDLEMEDDAAAADVLVDDVGDEADAVVEDDLSGLDDLVIEDAPAEDPMPDDLRAFEEGAMEQGVPAELLAEEAALEETLEDVADMDAPSEDDLIGDLDAADDLGDDASDAFMDDLADDAADEGDDFMDDLADDVSDEGDVFADDLSLDDMADDEPAGGVVMADDDPAERDDELPTAAIEELLATEASLEHGAGGGLAPRKATRRSRVDAGTVDFVPAVGDAPPTVRMIEESVELQREAIYRHTLVLIKDGIKLIELYSHTDARSKFEQALATLRGMGDRPEILEAREAARKGVTESMFGRAQVLFEELDYENSLKLAKEASQRGHRGATRLVAKISKAMIEPPKPKLDEIRRWEQKDLVEKKKDIRRMLREGREHYMVGEYNEAQAKFESILSIDPHNTEAIRWREKVSQRKYDRATMELESTRRDMIRMVRDAWNPRSYEHEDSDGRRDDDDDDDGDGREESEEERIRKKMAQIIIPEIDFRQANIHDVVDFIQQASVIHDPTDPNVDKRRGVNIILKLDDAADVAAAPAAGGDDFSFFDDPAAGDGGAGAVDLITFRAREISLLETLRIVTEVANLIYRIQGSVVMILPFDAPQGEIVHRDYDVLPTVGETVSRLSTGTGGGDRDSEFISLDAGGFDEDITDWKSFFAEVGVSWPRGSSIKYIPAIGKLLVANTAENLAVFEQRLAQLDVVPKQIEIEARFVEVNQTDLNSLGFEYIFTDEVEIAHKKNQANLPLSQQERIVLGAGPLTVGNRFLTDPDDGGSGIDPITATDNLLTFASKLTNPEVMMVLHALEQKGNTDLLSAPKVTTLTGIEAQIKVVTEFIYPSDYTVEPGVPPTLNSDGSIQSAGTPPVVTPAEFETREVGVILNVLPEVTPDSQMISLTMSPEVVTEPEWRNFGQTFTDAAGNLQQIPIEQPFFNSRSISTSIYIYDGATVVMGGMITEDRIQVDDRIPFLGDIPIIGRFFRSSYDNSVKRNLLIFVTARLVGPDGRPLAGAAGSAEALAGTSAE